MRQAALDLLQRVVRERCFLDEAAAAHTGLSALEPRDRAMALTLVRGCLRRMGEIDAVLAACMADGGGKRPPERVMDILRIGAAQLIILGTPVHAVTSTATGLLNPRREAAFRKFVIAILSRIERERDVLIAEAGGAAANIPAFLARGWRAAWAPGPAEQIARALMQEPATDLSARDETPAALEKLAAQLGADILPTGSLRLNARGDIRKLAGFEDGAWWVQDMAAALPVRLMGDVAGKAVIDLCAAPGGKTLQLAARGAKVLAVDSSPVRLERVRENLARTGLGAEMICADATEWSPDAGPDAVLVDAPCSATGTLRRHPDGLHIKREGDAAALAPLQAKLLQRACDWITPGGMVMYCTCSIEPGEGEEQIEALLSVRSDMALEPVSADEAGGLDHILTGNGCVRTLPFHAPGMDGFFIARLRKQA